jgi:hypothetical protein
MGYQGDQALLVWKVHHSIGDAMSCMALTLQMDDNFNPNKLLPFKKVGLCQRWAIRLLAVALIPAYLFDMLTMKAKPNPLHDGIRNLTGVKKVSFSELFMLQNVKDTAHTLGVTINDLFTASLSIAINRYFA